MTRTTQPPSRIVLALVAILIPAIGRAAGPHPKSTSHWLGTTQAGCGALVTNPNRCNAVQNIGLTLVRQGSKISGSYACAFGTQNCRGMQEKGKIIDGSLNGERVQFAVLTPDGVTCRYTGLLTGDSGKGGYRCLGGGLLRESGSWRIHRSNEHALPTREAPLLRR